MVRWYRKRIAVNEDTGQQVGVYTGISDWEVELYPSLYFEYFNNTPNYNTFQLLFPMLEGQAGEKHEWFRNYKTGIKGNNPHDMNPHILFNGKRINGLHFTRKDLKVLSKK